MKAETHNATPQDAPTREDGAGYVPLSSPAGVAPHSAQCLDCGNVYHIAQGHRCAAAQTLEEKIASNTWDHLRDFLAVAKRAQDGEWHWYENSKCKYVGLRIDMRTLQCIIMDRDGKRIDPEQLRYQYSERATGDKSGTDSQT
jgi:hypothetical protein